MQCRLAKTALARNATLSSNSVNAVITCSIGEYYKPTCGVLASNKSLNP